MEGLEDVGQLGVVPASDLHRLLAVADQDVGPPVQAAHGVGALCDLERARLEYEAHRGLRIQPGDDLVVVLGGVGADRAQIDPTGDLTRAQVGPVVVVKLMVDQDRAVLAEPEDEVAIARLRGIEPHEVGVDAFVLECRLHGAADLVVPDVGCDGGREAEAREADGGVGRVPTGLDRPGVLEWDLAAEGEVHPMPVVVLPDADVRVGQPDEHIGGGVTHTQHVVVVVRHGDM